MSARSRRGTRSGRAAAVLVALLATACGPQAAPVAEAPAPAATDAGAPAEAAPGAGAVAVARRAAAAGDGMPDVTGSGLDAARDALRATGARGSALVFADEGAVTAQFPAPGQPVPEEATVVLWVGAPAGVRIEVVDGVVPLAAGTDLDAHVPGTPLPDGLASWYGPGFEGDVTPCGERVDPQEVTFAGPDLPCGTRVRVTGPDGAVVEAVLTDRGPATWTGRRYNLSQAAFDAIADLDAGVVPIRVETLD